MQFIQCPHCGMKVLQTAKVCKGCQKEISNAKVVDIKTYSAKENKKKLTSNTVDTLEEENINYNSILENIDDSLAEQVSVVRESDDKIDSKSKSKLDHVVIIDRDDDKEQIKKLNFKKNILPRIFQIFILVVIIILIIIGIVIYNIMDLPEYYDKFHMRYENTKSFIETIVHLNVYENAKANPKLNFQVTEIENNFKNTYIMWKLIVNEVTIFTNTKYSQYTYVLKVKGERQAKDYHYIKMHMNQKMIKKLQSKMFEVKNEKIITITGRIIGWKRLQDKKTFEIELYNAEIIDEY